LERVLLFVGNSTIKAKKAILLRAFFMLDVAVPVKLSMRKEGGLKIVFNIYHWSNWKLFLPRITLKSADAPSCERLQTVQQRLFLL
jgi:hypothetical protein